MNFEDVVENLKCFNPTLQFESASMSQASVSSCCTVMKMQTSFLKEAIASRLIVDTLVSLSSLAKSKLLFKN